jgi:outer membrane protein OmpA-like peptidoglycan-associated protein
MTATNSVDTGPKASSSKPAGFNAQATETQTTVTIVTVTGSSSLLGAASLSAEERLAQLQIAVMKKIGNNCPHLNIDLVARRIDLTDMINFHSGTARIMEDDMAIVAEVKFAVKAIHDIVEAAKIPEVHLRIEGHVHKTKNIEKCWTLSAQRAEVICQHIVEGGTPMCILHPKGYGPSVPLGSATKDRRVEIHIMTDEELANWDNQGE